MNGAARRWSTAVPYAVAIGITSALFLWPSDPPASDASRAARTDPSVPVTTVTVTRRPLRQTYETTAIAAGVVEVKVAAQTRGLLRDVRAAVGSRVRAGDVIATQHDELLRADLEQAEAALARSSDERRRVEELAARQLADRNRLETAIAQHRYDAAAVDKARMLLDLARHRSPIDGIVTEVFRYTGDPVEDGSPIAAITDVSRMRVIARVPESMALRIRPGGRAELAADGLVEPVDARVARVYPAADPVSHQVIVELDAGPLYPRLRPGYLVRTRFEIEAAPDALALDRRGVPTVLAAGATEVLVVKDGRAEARQVMLGLVLDEEVEVVGGLSEGDHVIVAGQAGVRPGAAVRVVAAPAAP